MSGQLDLFDKEIAQPVGFCVRPSFISAPEESELVKCIGELALEPFQFGSFEGKRRVFSFGWRYDYTLGKLQHARPLPDWLMPISGRIERAFQLPERAIAQVLCTEYDTGAGIGWHRDKPYFGVVFGLSLQSVCRFRFRRMVDKNWERRTFNVEPRPLYQISGEARDIWEHSIPPVEAPRYSITFRTMRSDRLSRS